MTRDPDALSAHTFDVLVIGGGIYGLTIAYDAAQRGLSVALVERGDFGSGTSFNHLRTIHGGLRYLQALDFARARESAVERRAIATIAPHTVRPLPFVLPLSSSLARGPAAMRAGFAADRLVAFDRNRGVLASHRLPAGRVVSRAEARARFPELADRGLCGAAIWYDYVANEADRLTLAFALGAARHGATLVNHVAATALLGDRRRVTGARVLDGIEGRSIDVRGRVTVNATGSEVDGLLGPFGAATAMPMLKAMNLVTRRKAGESAIGGRSVSGRHLFMVPWRGRALFGTWESPGVCAPGDTGVTAADVAAFIAELNEAFPSLDLNIADVTLVHRGVVPARSARGRTTLAKHEQIRDHAAAGVEGLVSVVGAKYTTARRVAERVTDRLFDKLARPPVRCRTATSPLPGGDIADLDNAAADARRHWGAHVPDEVVAHLVAAYGSRHGEILGLAASRPELGTPLADRSPVIGAELVWAVRHEMAITLADAVIRRTPLGALGDPGAIAVARAADIVAEELGWPHERVRREVDALLAFYDIRGLTGADPATAP